MYYSYTISFIFDAAKIVHYPKRLYNKKIIFPYYFFGFLLSLHCYFDYKYEKVLLYNDSCRLRNMLVASVIYRKFA